MATAVAPSGYSGTPLHRKLSLKSGMIVWFDAMPAHVRQMIDEAGLNLVEQEQPVPGLEAAHIFVTHRSDMAAKLALILPCLVPAGFIWVSWPKKTSGMATDISEDGIRAAVLPTTPLVDVKVCAIDQVWSGLKLMIRRTAR